jgi:hypothetical protein
MSYLLHGSGCGRCGWRPCEGARCDGGSVEFEPTPTGGGDAVLPRHPQPSTRWARARAGQADPTTPAASCRAKSRCLAQCLTRERGLLDFDEIVFRIAIELKLTDLSPLVQVLMPWHVLKWNLTQWRSPPPLIRLNVLLP